MTDCRRTIKQVVSVLADLAERNKPHAPDVCPTELASEFECVTVPDISLDEYVSQFWVPCHSGTAVLMLIYIDTLCCKADLVVTPWNVHRLTLTAFLLALKQTVDRSSLSTAVGQGAGVDMDSLYGMEIAFLTLADWSLHVSEKKFNAVAAALPALVAATRAGDAQADRIALKPAPPCAPQPPSGRSKNPRHNRDTVIRPAVETAEERVHTKHGRLGRLHDALIASRNAC